MIYKHAFGYVPNAHESEKASNSYLMSLVAVMAGLPLPIINLVATLVFYFANRSSTYFVRWHCTQALLSQLSLLFVNSYGFWWTISLLMDRSEISNQYIGYMLALVILNGLEIIGTIVTAVETRKGKHVSWWFYGPLTNLICPR